MLFYATPLVQSAGGHTYQKRNHSDKDERSRDSQDREKRQSLGGSVPSRRKTPWAAVISCALRTRLGAVDCGAAARRRNAAESMSAAKADSFTSRPLRMQFSINQQW